MDVAGERRVDAVMKTGQVSTKVEVAGDLLPQVETTSTEIGGTLTAETIETLSGQWTRLPETDLHESRCGWIARPDIGFSRFLRNFSR